MGRRLATAAVLLVLAAGCGSHGAPNVKGKPFPSALARLRAHGWLVSVPSFPHIDGSLEDYRVVGQRTRGRRTVTLKIAEGPHGWWSSWGSPRIRRRFRGSSAGRTGMRTARLAKTRSRSA